MTYLEWTEMDDGACWFKELGRKRGLVLEVNIKVEFKLFINENRFSLLILLDSVELVGKKSQTRFS
jgi:hypothetical protein